MHCILVGDEDRDTNPLDRLQLGLQLVHSLLTALVRQVDLSVRASRERSYNCEPPSCSSPMRHSSFLALVSLDTKSI